jgi:riboflavin synthase alpha subunit
MLAKSVWASLPSDKRFLGKVTAVNGQSFTIQTRQGKSLTFQVTEETTFRSRRGVVNSLEELKPGMAVAVGAKELANSQYQAFRVLVAPRLRK